MNKTPSIPHETDGLQAYFSNVASYPLISEAEEIQLATKVHRGKIERVRIQARNDLMTANLRLVVKIARDYEISGVPLWELISFGNKGLMTAAERFHPDIAIEKGAKFSTYASWWIKQSILREIPTQVGVARLPIHASETLYHAIKLMNSCATHAELEAAIDKFGRAKFNKALENKKTRTEVVYLDAPFDDDPTATLGNTVYRKGDDVSLEVERNELQQLAVNLFQAIHHPKKHPWIQKIGLDDRDFAILKCRFDKSRKGKTLEETGKKFGVTRERIRQLQNMALIKLRTRLKKVDPRYAVFMSKFLEESGEKEVRGYKGIQTKTTDKASKKSLKKPKFNKVEKRFYDHTVASI